MFPVNIDGIKFATAQLVAKREGKIYLQQVKGIPTTLCVDGKTLRNVKAKGKDTPVYKNLYLLSPDEAAHLFLTPQAFTDEAWNVTCTKQKEAGPQRTIVKGPAKVAQAPTDTDFEQAALYKIQVPAAALQGQKRLLSITYQGDCARLYANGRLIADNFNYGRPFLYGLWRLPAGCTELELRILPMQADMPVYLPRETDKTLGEKLKTITIVNRK